MKRTIICNIPMKEVFVPNVLISDDESLPVSSEAYRYPINSFLSQVLEAGDELKVILLVKMDGNSFFENNVEFFKEELSCICKNIGSTAEYVIVDTVFSQDKGTHANLLGIIIDEISTGSHVMADITYGPKDLPILVFSALFFAENYLQCSIDNIVYGQAEFKDNKAVSVKICDMIPLYCLSSLSSSINCDDPDKARKMIKTLLSM